MAQWAASTQRSGPPCSTRLGHRVVAQVGGEVDVDAGRRGRRRRGRRRSRRRPRRVRTGAVRVAGDADAGRGGGQRRADPGGELAQRHRLGAARRPGRGRGGAGSRGQLDHVERRLLVRVRGAQRRDHGRRRRAAAAPSRSASRPPAPTRRPSPIGGCAPGSGGRCPVPRGGEGAPLVVADPAGTGRRQRVDRRGRRRPRGTNVTILSSGVGGGGAQRPQVR